MTFGPNVNWTTRNKSVSAFFFFNQILPSWRPRNATRLHFLILELDRPIKRKPIGIRRGIAHTLWEIDVLWLTLCSYISSEIAFNTRLIRRNGDRSFYCLPGTFAFALSEEYRILHLMTFLSINRLWWFPKKQRAYEFFFRKAYQMFQVSPSSNRTTWKNHL